MYTTKLTVELEVSTQFGPLTAVEMVKGLINVPAVTKATLTNLDTNYKLLTREDSNKSVMRRFPKKLK